jgi:lipoyl(octanoyl) transferase
MAATAGALLVRQRGGEEYRITWQAMRAFTEARTAETEDEIWLVEHPPVFTLGQAGKPEHLLAPGNIPVIQTDRGGQVTYHGPGQLVAYLLLDLRRLNIGPRLLVERTEQAIVATLAEFGIRACTRSDAHGVYVQDNNGQGRKIASLGLRIRRGCSYHGLSLNVDMDMSPFTRINPCGYAGLAMTSVREETADAVTVPGVAAALVHQLSLAFGAGAAALNSPPP